MVLIGVNNFVYLPGNLKIVGGSVNKEYKIHINYRNIEFSSDKQINFNVPSGFKKINLK